MHAYFPQAAAATLTLLATALAAPAHAATVPVTNCNDHGAGSLRNAAAVALDNDVIDMRGLSCARILLTSGPVVFAQPTITLQGPGPARLAIDGGGHSSVLRNHQAGNGSGGLLRIRDLTVRNGRLEDPVQAEGGCVYGYNLELEHVSVHHCVVRGPRYVSGGGVAATRDLRLIRNESRWNMTVSNVVLSGSAERIATSCCDITARKLKRRVSIENSSRSSWESPQTPCVSAFIASAWP